MIDHVVIIVYLLVTLAIGFFAGTRTKTFSDFAIGQRNISTFALLAAIMASIVDASETLDYAGEVINEGLVYCIAYLGAGFSSLALSYFFAPSFDRFLGKAHSTGDIIQDFFGRHAKILVGVAMLFQTTLFCGTQIVAISITLQYFFDISGRIASISVALITLVYFFRGGARSVNATDIFQFGILIVALPIFCGLALSKVGGYANISSLVAEHGINFTSSEPASYGRSLAMLILFSLPGQYGLVIQRMLMAKNQRQLRQVMLLDAIIGTLLRLMIIALGIAAFILLPNIDSSLTLLELANHTLPPGTKGLAVVGLLAIMMSTIDSTIHLGAVSLTQDIFSSDTVDDDKKLRRARYSSLLVIFGAILTSFYFESIGTLFYMLMILGNCLIWPAIFLGLTNFSSSKKGFWMGVAAGFSAVILCFVLFDIDLLYVNLIGTSASFLTHATVAILNRKRMARVLPFFSSSRFKIKRLAVWAKRYPVRLVKNEDYCRIFAVLSLFLSIYPFFIPVDKINLASAPFLFPIFSGILGTLAIMILFSEYWYQQLARLYPAAWSALVILSLPAQTYFMFMRSGFSLIWLFDAILIVPLITMLSNRTATLLFHIAGIAIAFATAAITDFDRWHLPQDFGYWTVLMHAMVLMLCFALFRKRDVELCRFEAATIAHEARRVLNTLESVADFYDRRLPLLIASHDNKLKPISQKRLSDEDLDKLLALPQQIQSLTERTRALLDSGISRIALYAEERILAKRCSINECILEAVHDSSLCDRVKASVSLNLKSKLVVRGDQKQLIQMFINILENAGHATVKREQPSIVIELIGDTVSITDNGCGISLAHMPSIYDEFFSTKSSNGQGLAFCKSVMREHGGKIYCSSKEDRFTRFELCFPKTN